MSVIIVLHSIPLTRLEHCVFTTSMTNIRPGLDSNPVPLSFVRQLDQMSAVIGFKRHNQTSADVRF